jgi:hypothetical protein
MSQHDFQQVTQIQNERDLENAFIQNHNDFVLYAFQKGNTYSDAENILVLVKKRFPFRAMNLAEFVASVKSEIDKQTDINQQFISLWTLKNKYVLSLVKRLVSKIDGADAEALAMDTWTVVLRKLSDGAFQERSSAETNGWLKTQARGVISDWKDKNSRRLTKAHDPNFEHDLQGGLGTGAIAMSYEDKEAVSPDENRKCPWGEDE